MPEYYYSASKRFDPDFEANFEAVEKAFSRRRFARVCGMHENEFEKFYDMTKVHVKQRAPMNFYLHKDNGSDVLAVAHLDTVSPHRERKAQFLDTAGGTVVYSRALDDRQGAYTILELLPKLGITYDWLLTTGEESGQSTAQFFQTEKPYNYMIEFDRGGTDVVMYQYDDMTTRGLVRDCGAKPAQGIFSDISYMEHLGVKGFNWGVGYRDYHYPRSHAWLDDYFEMLAYYLKFHQQNADVKMPHEYVPWTEYRGLGSSLWGDSEYYRATPTKSLVKHHPGAGYDEDTSDVEDPAEDGDDEESGFMSVYATDMRECDRIFGRDHLHDDADCADVIAAFADR